MIYEVDLVVTTVETRTVDSESVEGAAETAKKARISELDGDTVSEIRVLEVRKDGVAA